MTHTEKSIQVAHIKHYMWLGTHLGFYEQQLLLYFKILKIVP